MHEHSETTTTTTTEGMKNSSEYQAFYEAGGLDSQVFPVRFAVRHSYRSAKARLKKSTERFTQFDWLDRDAWKNNKLSWQKMLQAKGRKSLSPEHKQWVEKRLSGTIAARRPLETESLRQALCPKLLSFADMQLDKQQGKNLTADMLRVNKVGTVYMAELGGDSRSHLACVVRGKLYFRVNYDESVPGAIRHDTYNRLEGWLRVLYEAVKYRKLDNDVCFFMSNIIFDEVQKAHNTDDMPLPMLQLHRVWDEDFHDAFYWPEQDFIGNFALRVPPYAQAGTRLWNHPDWTEPGSDRWRKSRAKKGFAASAGQGSFMNRLLVHSVCPFSTKFNESWDTFTIQHSVYQPSALEQEDYKGYESYSNYQFALFNPGSFGWSSSYQRIMISGCAVLVPLKELDNVDITLGIHQVMTTKFCDDCYIPIKFWNDPTISGNCTKDYVHPEISPVAKCMLNDAGPLGWCKELHDAVTLTRDDDADKIASSMLSFIRKELSPMCYNEYMSRVLAGIRQNWTSELISARTSDAAIHRTFVQEFEFTEVDCEYLNNLTGPNLRRFRDVFFDNATCLTRVD